MDNARGWAWWAVVAAAALALAGCPRDIPPPDNQITDAAELLGAVRGTSTSVSQARFKDVRLDYFGQQGRATVRQLIAMSHPDRIRIQTYIPGMEDVAGMLVCACGRFAFHDRNEDVYYYGPATASNVARVLPVGLDCADLAHVMLGGAPHNRLDALGSAPALSWDRREGLYRLEWDKTGAEDERVELLVRHGDWRVARMTTWDAAGQTRYDYAADRFARIDGLVLPEKRRFLAGEGEDFSLTQEKVELDPDPEFPEAIFMLAPPTGSPVRYIGPEALAPPPPADGDLCAGGGR